MNKSVTSLLCDLLFYSHLERVKMRELHLRLSPAGEGKKTVTSQPVSSTQTFETRPEADFPISSGLPKDFLTPINCNYRTLPKYVKKIRNFSRSIDHGLQWASGIELYRILPGSERLPRVNVNLNFPSMYGTLTAQYVVPRRCAYCCEPYSIP
jgi:hypothetical protein